MCVYVCTSSTVKALSVWIVEMPVKDQRCYVEDVDFLCQVPSSPLQNEVTSPSN